MADVRTQTPLSVPPFKKSDKQKAAEARALASATARAAAGLCTKDLYVGFNCQVACGLPLGHGGQCSAPSM